MRANRPPLVLPTALHRRVDAAFARLSVAGGRAHEDFAQPAGEPALHTPDSLSWAIFKNPVVLFVGGITAVVLELAEPRVRTGIWEHTTFREKPIERMQRTAFATMMTVYGPRSRAEALIARVSRLHDRVRGVTPAGEPYCASDPELLTWVHATAAFGFLAAYHAFVRPVPPEERDRYFAEAAPVAQLYGAVQPPRSEAQFERLLEHMGDRLEPSDIVAEFLAIARSMPVGPALLRPVQRLLLRAGLDVLPPWLRERLGLARETLAPWQRRTVQLLAVAADRLQLDSSAPVQACRRLALPDDHLFRP